MLTMALTGAGTGSEGYEFLSQSKTHSNQGMRGLLGEQEALS